MKIRKVNIEDIPQLAILFDGYRVFYRKETDIDAAIAFLTERINLNDSVIYVCELEQKLVGFTQLYPLFSSTKMKRLWLLNDLYVDSDYRGKGISIQLIEQAKDLVRTTNAAGMYLETEKTNTIGNQLYPRVGFKINDVANYYEWSNDK